MDDDGRIRTVLESLYFHSWDKFGSSDDINWPQTGRRMGDCGLAGWYAAAEWINYLFAGGWLQAYPEYSRRTGCSARRGTGNSRNYAGGRPAFRPTIDTTGLERGMAPTGDQHRAHRILCAHDY